MGPKPSVQLDDHRVETGDDEQLPGQISIDEILREEVMPCVGTDRTDPEIHAG